MKDSINEKQKKPAYQRKNPRAAEEFAERKRAKNAARPKQEYVPGVGMVRA